MIVLRNLSQMNWCNLPGTAPKAQRQFIYCTDDPYPKSIMQPNKVESIKQRITQLENRLTQELARESDVARKLRSRQAIILGTWFMKNHPDKAREIADKGLRRDQDRAVFGLSPWKNEPLPRQCRTSTSYCRSAKASMTTMPTQLSRPNGSRSDAAACPLPRQNTSVRHEPHGVSTRSGKHVPAQCGPVLRN